MPTRQPNSARPQRVGPLDPDGVMPVDIDLSDWLQGDTLTGYTFTLPTEVDVGDGVTTVTAAGTTVTPPTPAVVSGVLTFYLFRKSGEDLAAKAGTDLTATVHYATATKADDCTIVFRVAER